MKKRRVRFTATAKRQIEIERSWWFKNRDHHGLFAVEFERAFEVLAILPGIGKAYNRTDIDGLRRFYLRKINCHLYYTFTDREVMVRTLWGARLEYGPRSLR